MSSFSSSKHKKPEPSSALTPQRKHRKLLKDGSGTEVWPESIENIFVQGLHEYWESPWAAYSQSRGRSRWRNQFLVDYLQKAGINRSKKQVASHIQVLRNMWKGEPEFYLVSGGEEPLVDSPVKLDDRSLISLDFDDTDGNSSSSASPDFSPPEFQSEFPPTPALFTSGYDLSSYTPLSKGSPYASPHSRDTICTTSMPSSLSRYPVDMAVHHSHEELPVRNPHYPLGAYPSNYGHVVHDAHSTDHYHYPIPRNTYLSHSPPPNRTTSICLLADGMSPLSIKLDALTSSPHSTSTALALKIRLCITPVDDIRSSSSLHGFIATVSLLRLWANSGKCITKVYTNSLCVSEEVGALEVSNIEVGTVNAMLPESSLNRCRWFDASITTSLTQEIVVDGEPLVYIIYDLDRSQGNVMPSAELMGYQNRKVAAKQSPPIDPPSPHSPHSPLYPGYPIQSSPPSRQPSLSSALMPTYTRHSHSMSF